MVSANLATMAPQNDAHKNAICEQTYLSVQNVSEVKHVCVCSLVTFLSLVSMKICFLK